MKKLNFILMMALACVFFVGCAAPHAVVDSSWSQKPTKVKVVFTEPLVANPDDLADDLPENVNNFSDWYKTELEKNLGTQTNGVLYSVEKISQDKVSTVAAPLNDVNIRIPKITEMENEADVYLVMNDVWIGRTVKPGTCTAGMVSYTCEYPFFSGKGDYAFFDAKSGQRLGYGVIAADVSYTFAVTKDDWECVVEKTVKIMLDETPLKK